MKETLLVGIDGSDGSRRALDFTAHRAVRLDARVLVAYIIDWSPFNMLTPQELDTRHRERQEELTKARVQVLEPMLERLRGQGLEVEGVTRHGHAAETLAALAREHNAVQIVVGRRGLSKVQALLFGSISVSLVQISPVPVTVVP